MRKVLPILMTITVAVLGCTMNRTPGNGQPVTATPSTSPATTYGTSYGNTPMSSSYVAPTTSNLSRADQAAAIMREHQANQPRFLGYLNPEPRDQQAPVAEYETGQFINPSLTANPEITVNSSISSQPYPVITGGAADAGAVGGSGGAFVVAGGASSGSATTATTSGTTAAATVAAQTAPLAQTPNTLSTASARGVTSLTPTLTSGATLSPLAASSAITNMGMASASGNVARTTTGTTATTARSTVAAPQATARLTLPSSSGVSLPLTVTTTPSGQILISNAKR